MKDGGEDRKAIKERRARKGEEAKKERIMDEEEEGRTKRRFRRGAGEGEET
jgi:hypothetical protein